MHPIFSETIPKKHVVQSAITVGPIGRITMLQWKIRVGHSYMTRSCFHTKHSQPCPQYEGRLKKELKKASRKWDKELFQAVGDIPFVAVIVYTGHMTRLFSGSSTRKVTWASPLGRVSIDFTQ